MSDEPRGPDDQRIKRYDLRHVAIFRRELMRRPWLGVVLFILAVVAGAALALGWVGRYETRRSAAFRTWAGAAIWWLFGAWVGAETVRALRGRRDDEDAGDGPAGRPKP